MAALCRTFASLRFSKEFIGCFARYRPGCRLISTSDKKKDTPTVTETIGKVYEVEKTDAKHHGNDNWITYGFSFESEEEDRYFMKIVCFSTITLLLCGGAFVLAYIPDLKAVDWTRREAYLELHRREKLGLPLIDRNIIPPDRIKLPTDEELGDTEIII